ncbi:MAG: N-formylglutamate deformylase [Kiloniellales bacterium]|nr:N-formylglutamate deformylase [Kiloniellales bacterium]
MDVFRFAAGDTPLLVSMPHVGTYVPPDIAARMSEAASGVPDTDWHVDRLYDFLEDLGASVIAATHSRYAIDLNRAPDGAPLYPGASETELCPTTSFDGLPLYKEGQAPDPDEVAARRESLWRPYHDRLRAALDDLRQRHDVVILWDAHSIRSQVPRFFEGRLPDLNLGTAGGTTAAADLIARIEPVLSDAAPAFSHVVDGRFKGGFITRRYGRPEEARHALQLELSQITYMDESPPFGFREDLAAGIRPVLRRLLEAVIVWAEETA